VSALRADGGLPQGIEPQARRYNDFSERGCPQPQRVATIRLLKVQASGSNFACCGWGHPRSVPDSGRRGRQRWPGGIWGDQERGTGAGNSGLSPQLPSAICNLPMKIVLD